MSFEGDMGERHGRVLAELAEAGMVMVRRLGRAMEQTDDARTLAQIGLAFHRVSRAVRQTVALEVRLAQGPRPEPVRSSPSAEPAPPRPRAERVGWSEYERDDSNEALEDLDDLFDAEEIDIEAVHEAIDASIARIRQDLDVPMPLAGGSFIHLRPEGRLSSPVGGPAEGRWREKSTAPTFTARPLHHAAHGPPPPTGEENGGFDPLAEGRFVPKVPNRRAQLMGAATMPRLPTAATAVWRSSG